MGSGSVPVPTASELMPGEADQGDDGADHQQDDADRPQDRNLQQEPDYEQDDPQDDHVAS
jgi:hypothetical protein